MAYSREVFELAKERLSERRQQALRTADYKREKLFDDIPRLREINNELLNIGSSIAKAVLKGEREQISIRELRDKSLALQIEQEDILSSKGIDKGMTEPVFRCPACGDTGYIELDNRTVICECFTKLMADIACEQLSDSLPLKRCTFESFSLDRYSDEKDSSGTVPLDRMSNIYNFCVEYADTFTAHSRSLLMRGATGLGKTHLSLAIANELIKKGFSVIYVSAPQILNKLEREHFSHQYDSKEDTFNSLISCDLLILDDLGTEFITQFSVSCVYNLFNSRLLADKPVIISTNLTLTDLVNTYSQRFVSRILGSCDRLNFVGDDHRTP